MIASDEKLLLELIKVALGKSAECALPDAFSWNALFELSVEQCVPAIVLDGLNMVLASSKNEISSASGKLGKLKWLGMVMNMEKQYANHERILSELASLYQNEGFRLMLLKGYGLSKCWPIPAHRPTGDIDIYLMDIASRGKGLPAWKRADRIMREKLGIKVDCSHHHHSVFTYKGIMVENHFDFVNVHSHRSNRWIEKEFKSLAAADYETYTFGNGGTMAFPSPLLHCLFVARHNANHFAAEHLNLRQLLDWMLLVEKRHEEVDWGLFWSLSRKMGMEKFVLCMVRIAVEHFAFDGGIFHVPEMYAKFSVEERDLIDRVMDDILHPTDDQCDGKGLAYVMNRYRLWKRNLWKHEITYSDGVVSTFFTQVVAHLMKPATIVGA